MSQTKCASVTDSVVYRSWQHTQRKAAASMSTERFTDEQETNQETSGSSDGNGSKWTFLQRLLAIEEAHDKRRADETMARKSSRRESTQRVETLGGNENNTASASSTTATEQRWTHGQVLDDNSRCTPEGVKLPPRESRTSLPLIKPKISSKMTTEPYLHHTSSLSDIDSQPIKLPRLPQLKASSQSDNASSTTQSQSQSNLQSSTSSLAQGSSTKQPSSLSTDDSSASPRARRKRPLRLPPILLPRVYAIKPRPLQYREFLTPTKVRGPITDNEWEDLKDCRYIRHALPRYSLPVSSSNLTFQS